MKTEFLQQKALCQHQAHLQNNEIKRWKINASNVKMFRNQGEEQDIKPTGKGFKVKYLMCLKRLLNHGKELKKTLGFFKKFCPL